MRPFDKAFARPLKTFYCQEIKKYPRSNLGRVFTVYHTGEQFGIAYMRAARGEISANGFRATGHFPCDKNMFRPHDFPLASEDTDAAPVSHLTFGEDQRSDILFR